MASDLPEMLRRYAQVIVKVGANVQPGQRLFIEGAPLATAPLVRLIAETAYEAGARYVDVTWRDDELDLIRYRCAPRDSFSEYPKWRYDAALKQVEQGDARVSIWAQDPDLLSREDPELVRAVHETSLEAGRRVRDMFLHNAVNSVLVAAAEADWATKVFPGVPPEQREAALWQAIFASCLVDRPDPITAWQEHIAAVEARCRHLQDRKYSALHFTGPGTDLTIGLPEAHLWLSCRWTSEARIPFICQMPADELFTLPHKGRIEGVVTSSKPRAYRGAIIDGARLEFSQGRVAKATADTGEKLLQQAVATDGGSASLGEVALAPSSTYLAQSGLLFYNILFDENAGSHIALGAAYPFSLAGGATMSDDEFAANGGNKSKLHLDFVIGSEKVDVDGLLRDGGTEPVMRRGEWAFAI